MVDIQKVYSNIGDGAAPAIESKEIVGDILDLPALDVGESGARRTRTGGGELDGEILWKIIIKASSLLGREIYRRCGLLGQMGVLESRSDGGVSTWVFHGAIVLLG